MSNTTWTATGRDKKPATTFTADAQDGGEWPQLKKCSVLIIEDEALQALATAQLVTELGAEVAGIATSVQGALAEISNTPFDVITLDLNMGGMFSLGMAHGLRDMGIPFVFCTAYGHIIAEFAEAPVVQKPITKEALGDGLIQALGRGARRH